MKKRTILALTVSLVVAISYCRIGALKALTAENIKSPRLECRVNKNLIDKNNKKLKAIDAIIFQKDNSLVISIKNSSDEADEKEFTVASDEKMFVVVKDRLNYKPIKKYFLDEIQDGQFQISLDMPYYYDMIYLNFYKQKKSDPDYTESDENFIGKTKICMRNVTAFYIPGQKIRITDLVGGKDTDIYIRVLPNFYRVDLVKDKTSENRRITKIVLLESQKDKMSEEESVNSGEDVRIVYPDRSDSNAFYDSFYIPKDIKEFTLLVYEGEITENETDVINEYDIKLERK